MKFKSQTNPKIHDDFIKNSRLGNLLNSSSWGTIKDNWVSDIVSVVDDKDEMLASSLVLIKKLALGKTIIYCPKGIVMDYDNLKLVSFFFKKLKEYGKNKKAIFIKFDPLFLNKAINPDGTAFQDEFIPEFIILLKNLGVKYQGLTSNMSDTIQPRYNAVVDKEDFSFDKLHKRTKQFINKAKRSYTDIKVGGIELISDFSTLMSFTENRKGVNLRDKAYYNKLLSSYPLSSEITLVSIDLNKLSFENQKMISLNENLLVKTQSEKKQKNYKSEIDRLTTENNKLEKLKNEFGSNPSIAGTLTVSFGSQTECLYAGMNDKFSSYYPSYLAWFTAIENSFNQGKERFNMGGINNDLSETDGLLKFKRNFLPTIEEYVGEFNLPVNKFLYPLTNWLYKKRK